MLYVPTSGSNIMTSQSLPQIMPVNGGQFALNSGHPIQSVIPLILPTQNQVMLCHYCQFFIYHAISATTVFGSGASRRPSTTDWWCQWALSSSKSIIINYTPPLPNNFRPLHALFFYKFICRFSPRNTSHLFFQPA